MRKFLIAAMLAALATPAFAIPALRVQGLQIAPNSASTLQTNTMGIWTDTFSRLRFDDGNGNHLYVATGATAIGTLAGDYANGGTGPQQFTLDATRLGLLLLDNATPISGSLLSIQDNAAAKKYFDVTATNGIQSTGTFNIGITQTANLSLVNTSTATSGAANQQYSPCFKESGQQYNGSISVAVDWCLQVRPLTGLTTAGEFVWWNRYNGGTWTEQLKLDPAGNMVWPTAGFSIYNNEAGGTGFLVQSGAVYTRVSNLTITAHSTGGVLPQSDNSFFNGSTSNSWKSMASYNYYGRAQAPTVTNGMAVAPVSGEQITLNLAATAIGSWTLTAGQANEHLQLCFAQDGVGSRTIGTPPANIIWQATTYLGTTHSAPVLTTTASKTDCFYLVYNTVLAKWVEVERSLAN